MVSGLHVFLLLPHPSVKRCVPEKVFLRGGGFHFRLRRQNLPILM